MGCRDEGENKKEEKLEKKWSEIEFEKEKNWVKECIETEEEKAESVWVQSVSAERARWKPQLSLKGLHYSCLTNLICRSAITLSAYRGGWLMSP